MTFSVNGLIIWVILFVFYLHHHREEGKKKCHYKSQRKNNIDWRPRGLWITYWGRFISAATSWHMQMPACCPVCAKKNNSISEYLENIFSFTWMFGYSALQRQIQANKGLSWLYQLLNLSHKCYWTDHKIFIRFLLSNHTIIIVWPVYWDLTGLLINANSVIFLPGFQTGFPDCTPACNKPQPLNLTPTHAFICQKMNPLPINCWSQ